MSQPRNHNPDILTCLANLSADEVFTPPKLAAAMLDILPQDLYRRPDTTFLDPVCRVATHFGDWPVTTSNRRLREEGTDVFIRFNEGVSVLKKASIYLTNHEILA